jgi:pimeloyl-ACP methyl ester carboxylesterase
MDDDKLSLISDGAARARAVADMLVRQAQRIGRDHAGRYAARLAQWPLAAAQAGLAGVTSDAWQAYMRDAMQRGIITLDVLRRRGNTFLQHEASGMPPVLDFAYETVIDGRTLPRPVNYSLLVITPPAGVTIDPERRPFMIVDPRAGHGAGIGGFKPESQVGDAFHDGHAVYFVVFRPRPEPGQALADVRDAEEAFLDEIARRHPKAEKPVIVGNCQGGWGCMLLAATAPDKVGPLAINGAPMSYWAGRAGGHPMRYTGGLVGGVTPALLMADLGHGLFDGSLLVQNFENLNPANTFWKKLYNLYAGVDTEAERFLEFERWWSGFFMMNKEEIRWIVENLFVGNRLSHGHAQLGDVRVDLRNIRSPIIVFCSHGDNITPPQQALNWIADLYRDVNEIKAHGQRIVYLLHASIGHLGIFVSAKIAGREHEAITETMRAIEALPPGLYEMVLEQQPDRLHIKFAPRGIDDLLALDDGRGDEEMFAAVAKISELGAHAYDTLVGPSLRALVTEKSAQLMFDTRPLRLERAALSDRNPLMRPVEGLAAQARADRQPVAADNPFLRMQQLAADHIEQSWDLFRDTRDALLEATFHMVYGSPWMRLLGMQGLETRAEVSAENLLSLPVVRAALDNIEHGGEAEATVRMLELVSNARGYLRRSRLERETKLFHDEEPWRSMDETHRARLIHEQSLIVQFAPDKAKSTLPRLLDTEEKRARALDLVMRIAGPAETMHPRALAVYNELESMLGRRVPPVGDGGAGDAATGSAASSNTATWPEQRSA